MKQEGVHSERRHQGRRSGKSLFISLFFFLVGLLSPVIGITISILGHFVGSNRLLNILGTILIMIAIPSLMIGAHLLDISDVGR